MALSHTSYRNKDFLINHTCNWVKHFQCTHVKYRSLTTTFYTFDSYKLWKPTACPHCCQSLSPLPLHQSPCPKYKNPTLSMPGLCSCQVDDSLMQASMVVSLLWIRCCKSFSKGNYWGPIPTLCWETMALTNSSLHSFVLQHMDVSQQTRCATWSKNLAYPFRVSAMITARNPSSDQIKSAAPWLISPNTKVGHHWKEGPGPFTHSSLGTALVRPQRAESGIWSNSKLTLWKGKRLPTGYTPCSVLPYNFMNKCGQGGGMLLLMVIRTH